MQNSKRPGGLLDLLLRVLSADIEVEIDASEVRFRRRGQELRLRPRVLLDASAPQPKVVGVGESVAATVPLLQVDIFDPRVRTTPPELKFDCLEAFFRYAFAKLTARGHMIRPRVDVVGAEKLSEALGGYEALLLRQALLTAGARECVFRWATPDRAGDPARSGRSPRTR